MRVGFLAQQAASVFLQTLPLVGVVSRGKLLREHHGGSRGVLRQETPYEVGFLAGGFLRRQVTPLTVVLLIVEVAVREAKEVAMFVETCASVHILIQRDEESVTVRFPDVTQDLIQSVFHVTARQGLPFWGRPLKILIRQSWASEGIRQARQRLVHHLLGVLGSVSSGDRPVVREPFHVFPLTVLLAFILRDVGQGVRGEKSTGLFLIRGCLKQAGGFCPPHSYKGGCEPSHTFRAPASYGSHERSNTGSSSCKVSDCPGRHAHSAHSARHELTGT
eukprot:16446282-Heterocapsa_arctica.AAC.2